MDALDWRLSTMSSVMSAERSFPQRCEVDYQLAEQVNHRVLALAVDTSTAADVLPRGGANRSRPRKAHYDGGCLLYWIKVRSEDGPHQQVLRPIAEG